METLIVHGKAYTIIAADDPEKGKGIRLRDGETDLALAAIFNHESNIIFYGERTGIPLPVLEHMIRCFHQTKKEPPSATNLEETIGIP